ncbi:MAG: hypothetical protein AMJ90_06175 [candidate division Zixibacteria bacterium SM23_73_2]|nr:MAG: hypothetical protein AMJ90_06175 [candidate division Zixibacteria bacterium SM23_73_2]
MKDTYKFFNGKKKKINFYQAGHPLFMVWFYYSITVKSKIIRLGINNLLVLTKKILFIKFFCFWRCF